MRNFMLIIYMKFFRDLALTLLNTLGVQRV